MNVSIHLIQELEKSNYKFLFNQVRYKHHKTKQVETVKKCEGGLEPCNVPTKKSIWNLFGCGYKRKEKKLDKKAQAEACKHVEFVTEEQAEHAMKQIEMQEGGKVFRTCGTAYILQKDYVEQAEGSTTCKEDQILEEMTKDISLKGQCDPMPPFQSVELRLIQLNERKLHPLYKKLMSIPKRSSSLKNSQESLASYKTRSGPILPDEFPAHLKINREMFEKKNILYEYKKTEIPQQMLVRILEMKQNERPPLVKKPYVPSAPKCAGKK
ncbi:uncharacterized protein LOC126740082 [Anthonomus grandis grandis]|uniref:uncharacterized protein LOC126740082 n=1 Tax=Anthonomus grandis grandis TaxID=2921223 RepID=UPI0021651A59|nr:uncharacterized protein LOC126740082 [Anthonomus grandis grandis]